MSKMMHAKHGASSSDRWINCPGSIALCDTVPETVQSPYAIEGNAAHTLAEKCLRKKVDAELYLDTEIGSVEVTEEMAEGVQTYLDYCRLRMDGHRHWIEHRFNLSKLRPPAPMFGTSDFVSYDGETLEVVDLKYGKGLVVSVVRNPQVRYYALGSVVEINEKPKLIRTTIVQPRASHPDGIIRSDEFGFDELVSFKKDTLFPAVLRTLEPNAPLVVGPWCKFCRALAVCPAQHAHAVAVAQSEFDEAPQLLPAPAALTQEQLQLVLEKMDDIESWFHAIRAYVQSELEAGREVPGWKLVPKRANRKWNDDEEIVEAWFDANSDLNDQIWAPRKLRSPAQIEKLLKGSKLALPSHLISKVSSGYNLAPASDPRPAIPAKTAENEFDVV